MVVFEVVFNLCEKFLDAANSHFEDELRLVSSRTKEFLGNVKFTSLDDETATQINPDFVKTEQPGKRKVTQRVNAASKKPKNPPPAPKNVPASKSTPITPGATMGCVTPTFGTMPDGSIICPVCKSEHKDMQRAKRHFDSAHSGVVFECEMCGCRQNRKDNMKTHLMKKHQLSTDIVAIVAARSQKIE